MKKLYKFLFIAVAVIGMFLAKTTQGQTAHLYLDSIPNFSTQYFCIGIVDTVILYKPAGAITNVYWNCPIPPYDFYQDSLIVTSSEGISLYSAEMTKTVDIRFVDSLHVPGLQDQILCGTTPITLDTTSINNTQYPTYVWNTGDSTQTISVNTTGIYTVQISNGCNTVYDTASLIFPLDNAQICMVTVDTILNKNKVIWEKSSNVGIDHYKILKESTYAGVYDSIGVVPYDSMSVFVDTSSHPDQMLARYRLLVTDTCGYVSDTSIAHQTILLQVSQGVPTGHMLSWNAYQGNFSFGTYYIYAGTASDNLVKIDSVANTVFSKTYPTPPVGQKYYQIAVKKSDFCIATSTAKDQTETYNTSVSNMEEYGIIGIEENQNNLYRLEIYPNPTTDNLTIETTEKAAIEILNIAGQIIKTINTAEKQTTIDVADLSSGIYIIKAKTDRGVAVKKFIKE